jgi:hypothetical protein
MLCSKAFGSDIEQLLSVKDLWANRMPPMPLDLDALLLDGPAASTVIVNGEYPQQVRPCH